MTYILIFYVILKISLAIACQTKTWNNKKMSELLLVTSLYVHWWDIILDQKMSKYKPAEPK